LTATRPPRELASINKFSESSEALFRAAQMLFSYFCYPMSRGG